MKHLHQAVLASVGHNMAYGDDAQGAIVDIKRAIKDYGSDIILREITKTGYNSYTGSVETATDINMRALPQDEATESVSRAFVNQGNSTSYEMAMKLYSEETITKSHKIVYHGDVYNILYVSSKVLQNETLLYEILIRR